MASYPRNTERRNFSKLSMAIVDLSSDVLRVILDSHTKPKDLANKVSKFDASEILRINKAANDGSYEKFDISFLYRILRCVCNRDIHDFISKQITPAQINNALQKDSEFMASLNEKELKKLKHIINTGLYDGLTDDLLHKLYTCKLIYNPLPQLIHPSKGWGNTPDENDRKLGDDIERIRIIRNTLYGHRPSTEIADTDFESNWKQLDSIMTSMNKHLEKIRGNKDFKNDLAGIYSSILSEEEEHYYIDEIKRLAELEKERAKRIDETISKVDDLSKQREEDMKKVESLSLRTKNLEVLYDITTKEQAKGSIESSPLRNESPPAECSIESSPQRRESTPAEALSESTPQSSEGTSAKPLSESTPQSSEGTSAEPLSESTPQSSEGTSAEQVYDVLILHAAVDRSDAIEFCTDIQANIMNINPNITLCDDFALDIQGVFETMEVVFDRCRYLFVYVTDNFTKTDLERYQLNIALVDSITTPENNNRIIPIWACTEGEKKMKVLRPLIGIKYLRNENNDNAMKNIKERIIFGRKKYLPSTNVHPH